MTKNPTPPAALQDDIAIASTSDQRRGEWRAGWPALLGASIGLAIGSGMFVTTSSLFVAPFQKAFGWSRLDISAAQSLGFLGSILAPAIGLLVNGFGLRRVAMGATAILCLIYLALSGMNGSLRLFSALCILLSLASSGTSGLIYGRVVTSWFERSRGLALAASRAGPAIVGSLTPSLLYAVIEAQGWRAGYWVLAAVTGALGLPAIFWLVREPGGPQRATVAEPAEPVDWRRIAALLRDGRLWSLLVIAFLLSLPLLGLTVHLHPLLTSHGLSGAGAAGVIGGFSASILIGTFVSGVLMDRYGPRVVGSIFLACAILGFLALATFAKGPGMAAGAVLLIGVNQGVENDLFAFLIARQFGRAGFAPVYGLMIVAIALAAALGAALFGALRDRTGSYDAALWLGAASLLGAVAMLLIGGRPSPAKPGLIGGPCASR